MVKNKRLVLKLYWILLVFFRNQTKFLCDLSMCSYIYMYNTIQRESLGFRLISVLFVWRQQHFNASSSPGLSSDLAVVQECAGTKLEQGLRRGVSPYLTCWFTAQRSETRMGAKGLQHHEQPAVWVHHSTEFYSTSSDSSYCKAAAERRWLTVKVTKPPMTFLLFNFQILWSKRKTNWTVFLLKID